MIGTTNHDELTLNKLCLNAPVLTVPELYTELSPDIIKPVQRIITEEISDVHAKKILIIIYLILKIILPDRLDSLFSFSSYYLLFYETT